MGSGAGSLLGPGLSVCFVVCGKAYGGRARRCEEGSLSGFSTPAACRDWESMWKGRRGDTVKLVTRVSFADHHECEWSYLWLFAGNQPPIGVFILLSSEPRSYLVQGCACGSEEGAAPVL